MKEVAGERDSLKAEVSSLTKEINDVKSQLQQVAKEKKGTDQQPAANKGEAKVLSVTLHAVSELQPESTRHKNVQGTRSRSEYQRWILSAEGKMMFLCHKQ